ncbi:hypothetical protein [Algoriphagus sp.]|uniref:hypothetical protein n=1 Tax=Algoriphagus sp. TaxID=1872435 RepID=UPI00391A4018
MKLFILLFCFAFGLSNLTLAQDTNVFFSPHWLNKKLPDQPKIDFRNHLFLDKLDTLQSDSIEVHFPMDFLLNRELNSSNLQPGNSSLPFFELPPSTSRMPIIPFDESVNYTILRKEFK